jgi:hypothetical protein
VICVRGYSTAVDAKTVGDAGLHGWKETFANAVARRAPVADDVVRAALGTLFFALSLRHVIRSLRAVGRELRS